MTRTIESRDNIKSRETKGDKRRIKMNQNESGEREGIRRVANENRFVQRF